MLTCSLIYQIYIHTHTLHPALLTSPSWQLRSNIICTRLRKHIHSPTFLFCYMWIHPFFLFSNYQSGSCYPPIYRRTHAQINRDKIWKIRQVIQSIIATLWTYQTLAWEGIDLSLVCKKILQPRVIDIRSNITNQPSCASKNNISCNSGNGETVACHHISTNMC